MIVAAKDRGVVDEIAKFIQSSGFANLLTHVEMRTKGEPWTMLAAMTGKLPI